MFESVLVILIVVLGGVMFGLAIRGE